MKITVLDRATMGSDLSISPLYELGEVTVYENTTQEELEERACDAEVLVLNKVKISADTIKAAKNLKLVCVFATGYDNIDVAAARLAGVGVCNVPAYSTDSVALFTVANALSLFTHLSEYRNFVASGEYSKSGRANCLVPVYHEMRGKTWGIIGFGNIGRAVGRIAEAMGAKVIVNKRTPIDGYECVDINTLCSRSDIITVHCPLNDATRGLISDEQIALMKRGVVIVNGARGAVLDEAAIAKAVIDGRIGAFGSDVYSEEPFGKKHPMASIASLPNVCLTPHAAWGAYEARERCLNVICDNIRSFVSGKTLNRVDILGQN